MVKQLGADASYYGLLQSSFSALQLLGGLLSGAHCCDRGCIVERTWSVREARGGGGGGDPGVRVGGC